MQLFTVAVLLPALAAALTPLRPLNSGPESLFAKRQSGCYTSEKECGQVCIPLSYTCCPDREGGCSASEECQLGDNGVYGCCPLGESCTGDGGTSQYYTSGVYASTSYSDDSYYTTTSRRSSHTTSSVDSFITDSSESTSTSRTTTRRTSSATSSSSAGSSSNDAATLAAADGLVGLVMSVAGFVGGMALIL